MFLAADEMMKKMDERDDKLDETISPILGNIQETGNFEAAGTAKFILNNLRQGGLLTTNLEEDVFKRLKTLCQPNK